MCLSAVCSVVLFSPYDHHPSSLDRCVAKCHEIRARCRVVHIGVRLLNCSPVGTSHTLPADWRNDERYRWTLRVGLGGVGFLATLAAFVAMTRIFNLVVASVQPEAWALGAMLTAPFTIGVAVLVTIATALVETVARVKRRAVGA